MARLIYELTDGRTVTNPQKGRTFRIDGINHDETCLQVWSPQEIREKGIKVIKEMPYDQKHYHSVGIQKKKKNGVEIISHITEPKMTLYDLKTKRIEKLKSVAFGLLSESDWYVLRQTEEGKPMPEYVKEYRKQVRERSNEMEQEIENIEDYQAVIDYQFDWPAKVNWTVNEVV